MVVTTPEQESVVLSERQTTRPADVRVQRSARATPRDVVALLRPRHWIKNVVVFAGPAAGLQLTSAVSMLRAVVAFASFCLISSAVYAVNDAVDRKADARHPTKRNRPVARGVISPFTAITIALLLTFMAAGLALTLPGRSVVVVLGVYLCLALAYTFALKKRVILDVIIVALGFVLRAWAGALAVGVEASSWLIACVFTLCLFMGFGKRRCEVVMLGNAEEAGSHRRTLLRYTPTLLAHMIAVSAGIAVITFLLYTLDTAGHPSAFPKQHLFYTLPIVVYGVFRFAMLTELGVYAGPTEMIFKDRALLTAIVLWAGCALVVVYQVALFGTGGLERFVKP